MQPIETKTLRLEPLTVAHAEEMFGPLSAPALYDYTPGAPPASVAALRERYAKLEKGTSADGRQQWLNWIIRLASGRCVGFVQATIYPGRTGDFAFVLAPEHWGHGIASEACRAAIAYLARELALSELFATVDPNNARSIRLLLRLGFDEVAPVRYPHGEVEPHDRVFRLPLTSRAGPDRIERQRG
ncbi:MAG TPA: GNAT family N-acetyltransferase [Casimicrobiaceae bacterium]